MQKVKNQNSNIMKLQDAIKYANDNRCIVHHCLKYETNCIKAHKEGLNCIYHEKIKPSKLVLEKTKADVGCTSTDITNYYAPKTIE